MLISSREAGERHLLYRACGGDVAIARRRSGSTVPWSPRRFGGVGIVSGHAVRCGRCKKALTCWLASCCDSDRIRGEQSRPTSPDPAPRAPPPTSATSTRSAEPGGRATTSRSVGAGPLRAVFLQFVEQRLLADAQDLGRAGLVVLGVFERQLDQRALGLFDGIADRNAQLALSEENAPAGTGAPPKPGGRCARSGWCLRRRESPRAPERCAARGRFRASRRPGSAPARRAR